MAAEAKNTGMSRYVLDSFAILAYYWDERGASRVQQILEDVAHERWMTVINLGEVYYKTAKRAGSVAAEEAADGILRRILRLPIELIEADTDLTLAAARIKARYALAYADCFAAALARQRGAAVVTGDLEFGQLEHDGIVEIEWLLPKPKTKRR